jgi:16S rRNA processing protein RimM
MGRVSGFYGLKGWVKVLSFTRERDGILGYDPLYLYREGQWRPLPVEDARIQGKGLILKLAGCDDRDEAATLLGAEIAVHRAQLATLGPDEYYWTDLEGLRVVTLDDVELGRVERLLETGANDVVVVRGDRERLIPFLRGEVIAQVDLAGGIMRVDWDPEF